MARRRRGLTPEEGELWSRIARTAKPMHPAGPQPVPRPLPEPLWPTAPSGHRPTPPVSGPAVSGPEIDIGRMAAMPPASRFAHAPTPAERLASVALRMDHKTHKRMTKGKLRPEARLDLHGMTLAAAHPELIAFILSCHAAGRRLVLVITGKGRGDHGPLPTRPGALRHQVPVWLHQPPLAAVVQQVTAAHYRHGGEGAYYVYLRKRAG
ncbi:Smr/MutS family protein [Paracoccus sp. (in: a-proteobacteria)]|uniref:Smr/MutS family protein n=1 Tax=Paracoccus sp. TaxID=267 RepID=UPI003A897282